MELTAAEKTLRAKFDKVLAVFSAKINKSLSPAQKREVVAALEEVGAFSKMESSTAQALRRALS